MKLLLTGATGAAGSQIFRDAVADPAISSITVLSRRALPDWLTSSVTENTKTSTIIVDDFLKYPADLPPQLASHDACIWALGTSSIGISEQDYTKITYDYLVSTVEALRTGGISAEPFRFIFFSGSGADHTSSTMFKRVKGNAEQYLLNLPADARIQSTILRPGAFFPSQQAAMQNTRSLTERVVLSALKPVFSGLIPSKYIPIEDLSKFALGAAKGKWGGPAEPIFSNSRMREVVAQSVN